MLTLLALLSTIGSGALLTDQPLAVATDATSPPVRLWMNNDRRFRPGDRVRLQVDADTDGYLLVLNYDTDGRVRVLFPLDPRDDSRVVAGRRYEVRDGDSQSAFRASGDGTGLIFTAVAQDPWRFDEVVLAGRWDYTRLEIDRATTNPEEDLSNLVQSIAGPKGFDYDVLGYRVYGESSYSYNTSTYPSRPIYVYDDYLYCNNWSWRYDGCHRWPYDGGWSFGLGFYSGYSRYGYGYGYGGYHPFGYYPYYPSRPGYYNRGSTIVGRPRNYAVVPRTPVGGVGTGRFAGSNPSGRSAGRDFGDIDWRTRARPAGGIATRAPSGSARGSDRGPDVAPPARRSRPDGAAYPVSRGSDNSGDRGRRDPSSYVPRGGNDDARSAPPRSEPSRREAPPPRSDPSRREAPPPRSDPSRREAPPPRSEPSRREAPPPRAEPSRGSRGSSGGHSSPPASRPRRP